VVPGRASAYRQPRAVGRGSQAVGCGADILDDALPSHITLFDLAVGPPALWDEQRKRVGL